MSPSYTPTSARCLAASLLCALLALGGMSAASAEDAPTRKYANLEVVLTGAPAIDKASGPDGVAAYMRQMVGGRWVELPAEIQAHEHVMVHKGGEVGIPGGVATLGIGTKPIRRTLGRTGVSASGPAPLMNRWTWRGLTPEQHRAMGELPKRKGTKVRFRVGRVTVMRLRNGDLDILLAAEELECEALERILPAAMERASRLTHRREVEAMEHLRKQWQGDAGLSYTMSLGRNWRMGWQSLPGMKKNLIEQLNAIERLAIDLGGGPMAMPQPRQTKARLPGAGGVVYQAPNAMERLRARRIILTFLATELWSRHGQDKEFIQPLMLAIGSDADSRSAWNRMQTRKLGKKAPIFDAKPVKSGSHDPLKPWSERFNHVPKAPRVRWKPDPMGLLPVDLPDRSTKPGGTIGLGTPTYDNPTAGPPFNGNVNGWPLGKSPAYLGIAKRVNEVWAAAFATLYAMPEQETRGRAVIAKALEDLRAEWAWLEEQAALMAALKTALPGRRRGEHAGWRR